MRHQTIKKDLRSFSKEFNSFLKKKFILDNNTLNQSIKYSINSGGKRFRPYLVYVFGKEFQLPKNIIFNLGSAIEMLHNYSLVHDDLPSMDNDKYRRGKKTTHYKYNEFTAVLAGCGLLTKSYLTIASKKFNLSEGKKIKLIQLLSEFSGEKGLLLGQYIDLSSSNTKLEERIELNQLKTGVLMSFCCQAVAICAGKSKKIEKSLADIGMYIGEIFQINDDFEDFPRMSAKNKKFLENYKLKLSQKIFSIFKKINLKNKKTYLLIEFLLDLKV